jgi:hypothetical protein
MFDANLNSANIPQGHQTALPSRLLAGTIVAAFLVGAAALWWRFGEGVYLNSMMSAIIACF